VYKKKFRRQLICSKVELSLNANLLKDQEMIFNFMNNYNSALISKNNFMIIKMRAVLMIYSGLISQLVQIDLCYKITKEKLN